ncbi:MAG: hypothetical protein JSU65_10010 [Candidatus Zixiibacteriota bacterium]|nr:MAG: hypothetical protein JSU65_10010 [candidate division Zixibacteria bacterium]
MKKYVALFCLLLLAAMLVIGCTAEQEPQQEGAAGQPEETADSTRMDAAEPDTVSDTAAEEAVPDTAG